MGKSNDSDEKKKVKLFPEVTSESGYERRQRRNGNNNENSAQNEPKESKYKKIVDYARKKKGKKSPLAYASPFPEDNTINNNNNNNFSNGVVEEEKEEISTEIEYGNVENPGAFAVKPGGYFRPAGQTSFSSLAPQKAVPKPKNTATTIALKNDEDNLVAVPHATLVQEEEDFDTRLRKMFKGAMAVEVVPADNEEIEIIETSSKNLRRKKTKRAIILCLVLLLIIATTIVAVLIAQKYSKDDNNTDTTPTLESLGPPLILGSTVYEIMTLYLKLGKDSNAVGFELSCGLYKDDVIEKRSKNAFKSKPGGVATVVYTKVPVDKECTIKVTNSVGTGLQPGGMLRIHQGETISDDSILLEVPGNFTDEASGDFELELIASQVPTTVPTEIPSNTPSLSPSKMPSISNNPTLTPLPTDQPSLIMALAPTPRPSNIQTFSPILTNSRVPTPIQSLSPSASPTFLSYSITVDIYLDSFPLETGWNLTCDGTLKASFPPRSYIDPTEEILLVYDDVNYNAECLFVIVDTAEDGICCSNGYGRYNITILGDANTTLLTIGNDGQFGAGEQEEFRVG